MAKRKKPKVDADGVEMLELEIAEARRRIADAAKVMVEAQVLLTGLGVKPGAHWGQTQQRMRDTVRAAVIHVDPDVWLSIASPSTRPTGLPGLLKDLAQARKAL